MGQVLFETHLALPWAAIMPLVGTGIFLGIRPFILWASRTFNFPLSTKFNVFLRKWSKAIMWTFVPIALFVLWVHVSHVITLQMRYHNGDYLTVEGYVEDFATRYHEFMGEESFTVDGVYFCYEPDANLPGTYHYVRGSKKGVITGNGQHLKIGYVEREEFGDRVIIYIEELPPEVSQENSSPDT